MKRSFSSALPTIAALALLAGGCSSDPKPVAQSIDQRAAAVPMQVEDFSKLGYRLDWRGFATMLPGKSVDLLEPMGDAVAVQESGGVLTVLEARNGSTRWSDQVSNQLTRFVGAIRDNDRLIVSSDSEAFYYDIATGTLKARHQLAIVVNTAPVKLGDILVYGSANGQVLGHLTLNGFRQWGAMTSGQIESDPLALGAPNEGRAAIISSGGDIIVVDGATGLISSRARIALGADAPLAANDALLFVASVDHSLYAIALNDGTIVWRERTGAPLHNAPVVYKDAVYCDMGETGLSAFDAASGEKLWNNAELHGTVVALRDKRLIVRDGTSMHSIDPAKGTIIETIDISTQKLVKPDAFENGNLYLAAPNGVITKLVPR
jgi:outer membrane protein assembly factor BamB